MRRYIKYSNKRSSSPSSTNSLRPARPHPSTPVAVTLTDGPASREAPSRPPRARETCVNHPPAYPTVGPSRSFLSPPTLPSFSSDGLNGSDGRGDRRRRPRLRASRLRLGQSGRRDLPPRGSMDNAPRRLVGGSRARHAGVANLRTEGPHLLRRGACCCTGQLCPGRVPIRSGGRHPEPRAASGWSTPLDAVRRSSRVSAVVPDPAGMLAASRRVKTYASPFRARMRQQQPDRRRADDSKTTHRTIPRRLGASGRAGAAVRSRDARGAVHHRGRDVGGQTRER